MLSLIIAYIIARITITMNLLLLLLLFCYFSSRFGPVGLGFWGVARSWGILVNKGLQGSVLDGLAILEEFVGSDKVC